MTPVRHLFLTGFRGTGKSTVAAILGERLGRVVVDLDEVIERRAGKSIREIFEAGGEGLFRDLESAALAEEAQNRPAVISLGGGAILREANRALVRQTGRCFWLDADAETIVGRLRGDANTSERRPALTNLPELEEVRHLLLQRQALYQAASDHRIETEGKQAREVADEILEIWNSTELGVETRPDTPP